jgi:diaminopimelate decarboxylase
LLSPLGYLVATVRSVAEHEHFGCPVATLDASAWNLAPWHRPEVVALHDRPAERREYYLAGNTLYEGDFFGSSAGNARPRFRLATLQAEDRVLLTCAGAYTMTNGRRFHRLPLPQEYAVQGGAARRLQYSYEQGFA